MAAGPGVASENEGFAGVGAPPGVLVAGAFGLPDGLPGLAPGFGFGAGFADFLVLGFDDGLLGLGVVFGLVVVFGAVVVGVLGVVRAGVVEEVVVVLGVVTVGELFGDGQDSFTFWTGPGRFSEETGAPGGSWKLRTWPLSRVTVTVQSAAEALGSATISDTTRAVPADARATLSFRRINTVALFPPAMPSAATVPAPDERSTGGSSY
jgi:hypothetical protein